MLRSGVFFCHLLETKRTTKTHTKLIFFPLHYRNLRTEKQLFEINIYRSIWHPFIKSKRRREVCLCVTLLWNTPAAQVWHTPLKTIWNSLPCCSWASLGRFPLRQQACRAAQKIEEQRISAYWNVLTNSPFSLITCRGSVHPEFQQRPHSLILINSTCIFFPKKDTKDTAWRCANKWRTLERGRSYKSDFVEKTV